ncbi:hypothetical protein [Pseudomonas sp. TE50-2]|uniref:hypothetical protein n=1 Tax=Pseudomonas sp. TE50-2 TaxID=3142707 RepID=UPI003467996D
MTSNGRMADYFPILSFLRVAEDWHQKPGLKVGFFVFIFFQLSKRCPRMPFRFLLKECIVTTFADIRSKYTAYRNAQQAYWSDLQQRAFNLGRGFEGYLGLKDQRYKGANQTNEPYLQVGVVEGGKFKRSLGADFKADGLKVDFCVSLVVDEAPDELQKRRFLINLKLGKNQDGYVAELLTAEGPISFQMAKATMAADAVPLYEAIALEIIDKLDPSVFD